MVTIKCEKCRDYTHHLIIFKGNEQFWECQNCHTAEVPVLTHGNT